jgi:hyaluronan synthase
MTPRALRRHALVVAIVLITMLLTTVFVVQQTSDLIVLAYWTLGASVLGVCLTAFVVGKRYTHLPPAPGRVLCIVPAYNEPPEILHATIESLLAQTVPVDIVVIDDGSQVPVLPTTDDPRVDWRRQKNTGKRGAQVAVLRSFPRDQYAFVLTVDSDSQPYPDACEQLLRAMSDPKVEAVTGMIYTCNHNESIFSLAADMDIGTSCVMMRASRSLLGALETTSGALAMYRSALLYDHLDAYAVECGTGDDRWLSLRALRRGQVVAVAEARVETHMPTTARGTYRQRLRWARSWWWMLPYVFRNLRYSQMLSPLYGLAQLLISPVCLFYILLELVGLATGTRPVGFGMLTVVIMTYLLVRFGLAALYLVGRPMLTRREKLRCLIIGTPAAVVLNLLLLSPTRYWALARLMDNRWQTRSIEPQAAQG